MDKQTKKTSPWEGTVYMYAVTFALKNLSLDFAGSKNGLASFSCHAKLNGSISVHNPQNVQVLQKLTVVYVYDD
jgi:hypothetical protein